MLQFNPHYGHEEREKDEELLMSLGYKQEFKRDYSALELFGIGFSLNSVVPAMSSVLVYAAPNGGPVAMVWGWATACFFLVFVCLAMAELGSSAPMAGGLYYWTFKFSSPRYRKLLSWIVGYTDLIAYVAGIAGVEWGTAVQIMAAVSIGSDLTFVPTVYQTYGVFCALLLCHVFIASLATKYVARLQNVFIAVNVALIIAVLVALPASTPSALKNNASFALGTFENMYSWPNGFAFILSFLAPTWAVGGFDFAVHISEESRNANIAVPWAIVSSTLSASVLGWAINVVLVFCMGTDLASILSNPIGQPMATIFFNSLGKKGTLAIWSFIIFAQFMTGIDMLTVCSRQQFAFARDGALPFSRFLYRINRYTGTPVNCVVVSAFLAALLGLLCFAGPAASGAVFALSIVSQYVSDSIPIMARFLGGHEFKPGPFYLGAFSLPVAVIAVSWMTFMSVVLLFPTTPQTTPSSMNYTVVVFGGVTLLAVIYYFFPKYGGRNWFQGPTVTVAERSLGNENGPFSASSEKMDEKL